MSSFYLLKIKTSLFWN